MNGASRELSGQDQQTYFHITNRKMTLMSAHHIQLGQAGSIHTRTAVEAGHLRPLLFLMVEEITI